MCTVLHVLLYFFVPGNIVEHGVRPEEMHDALFSTAHWRPFCIGQEQRCCFDTHGAASGDHGACDFWFFFWLFSPQLQLTQRYHYYPTQVAFKTMTPWLYTWHKQCLLAMCEHDSVAPHHQALARSCFEDL